MRARVYRGLRQCPAVTPEDVPLGKIKPVRSSAALTVALGALLVACATGCGGSSGKTVEPTIDTSPAAHALALRFAKAVMRRDLAQTRQLMRGKTGLLSVMLPIMNQHSARTLTDHGHLKPCAADGAEPNRRCFLFGVRAIGRTAVYDAPGGKLLRVERRPIPAHVLVEILRDAAGRFVASFLYSESPVA